MKTHSFSLILGSEELTDSMVESLFESCGDCVPGKRMNCVYVAFDRHGDSLKNTIEKAIKDVSKAGLDVIRVEPDDLASQSAIAERLGKTREYVRLLIQGERGPGSFPHPIAGLTTSSPLWSWHEVAKWCLKNKHIDSDQVKEAEQIVKINDHLVGKR